MAQIEFQEERYRDNGTAPPLNVSPQEPFADNNYGKGRWSSHLQNRPEWVTDDLNDWAKSIYDAPGDPNAALRNLASQYRAQWGNRAPADDASLFQMIGRAQSGQSPFVGNQFDDPYTAQLESIARNQLGEIRSSPGLDQWKMFLQNQFTDLSTAPGFSPEEMAVLRTQAIEPIEDLRQASRKRSLERASARGFLPSSGITDLQEGPAGNLESYDVAYDRMRTQAGRDLAVNAIDRRDQDLQRAMQYAQILGWTIPQGQRSEELNVSRMLQRLPSESLQDLLAVLNGSPTSAQLGNQAAQTAYQDQLEQQRQAELWRSILEVIGGMDF